MTFKVFQTFKERAMPPHLDLQDLILALRPDLCERFGFDTPQGRPGFLAWLMTSGLLEYKALFDDPEFRARLHHSARGKGPLTGLQRLLWQARPDVQQAFALPAKYAEYLHWFYHHGVGEHGVWHFLEPAEKVRALQQEGPWQASFKKRVLDDALRPPAVPWRQRPWGVNVVGYAFGQLGIGEDARMAATALHTAGVPMCMLNFEPGADVAQNDMSMQAHVTADGPYAVNLFCMTAWSTGVFMPSGVCSSCKAATTLATGPGSLASGLHSGARWSIWSMRCGSLRATPLTPLHPCAGRKSRRCRCM
jgi:hypothetical protein